MKTTARRSAASEGWRLFQLFSVLCYTGNLVVATAHGSRIPLYGASGSGPFDLAKSWANAFTALHPEAEITLSSVGSGAAQKALWGDIDCENKPVEALCDRNPDDPGRTIWGIGDAPIGQETYTEQDSIQLQQFRACAGAVLMAHSNDVTGDAQQHLQLSLEVIGGIFNGTIIAWDDPAIARINPTLSLPNELISVIVRGDSSGQTSIITSALGAKVDGWPQDAVGKRPNWPLPGDFLDATNASSAVCEASTVEDPLLSSRSLHFNADGKSGIASGLIRIPYSISYMEMGFHGRLADFISQVDVSSEANPTVFVTANNSSIEATMDGLSTFLDPRTLEVDLAAETTPMGGYPISGYAYWYLKQNHTAFSDCYQAWLVCKFIEWSYTSSQAADIAFSHGWVSPPKSIRDIALNKLENVKCIDVDGDPATPIFAMTYVPPPYRPDMNYIDDIRPIVWSLGGIIIATSIFFIAWVVLCRNVRIVKISQPSFLVMLCFGTLLLGSAIFPLGIDDDIASTRGCDIACMSWAWLIPCGFTIAFSALFSKIWRINILIRYSRTFRRLKVEAKDALIPFGILISLNVTLLLAWTLTDPLKWTRELVDPTNSIGKCQAEGDSWWIFLTLIVVVNFGAICLANYEAYKARHISDELSETKYVALAMASMLQVLIVGGPLVVLLDDPSNRLFVFSGILFVVSMSLLLLIFIPKMLLMKSKLKLSSLCGHTVAGTRPTSKNNSGIHVAQTPQAANFSVPSIGTAGVESNIAEFARQSTHSTDGAATIRRVSFVTGCSVEGGERHPSSGQREEVDPKCNGDPPIVDVPDRVGGEVVVMNPPGEFPAEACCLPVVSTTTALSKNSEPSKFEGAREKKRAAELGMQRMLNQLDTERRRQTESNAPERNGNG